MITPRMMACLKQLHLPAFLEHYAPQAALAGNEGWAYDRYLLGLCELELAERVARRIQRLLSFCGLGDCCDSLRRSGIKRPGRGAAHLLRHSVASSMLRQGASLQELSALLRHRSIVNH